MREISRKPASYFLNDPGTAAEIILALSLTTVSVIFRPLRAAVLPSIKR